MAAPRRLPYELEKMITDILQTHPRSSGSYPAVCKEWQAIFEPYNFRRLILSPSDLYEFARIVQRKRRTYVRHIWLRVELDTFACENCWKGAMPKEVAETNLTFNEALRGLFIVLNRWKNRGPYCVPDGILTLELSTLSPSALHSLVHDGRERFKEDEYPSCFDEECTDESYEAYVSGELAAGHDEEVEGYRLRCPATILAQTRRQQRKLLRDHPKTTHSSSASSYNREDLYDLPHVYLIKKILIRSQYFNSLDVRSLELIFWNCDHLEEVALEPWWGSHDMYHDLDQHHYAYLFMHVLTRSQIKKLSIFGNSKGDPVESTDPSLGNIIYRQTFQYEQICISFIIDAHYFFKRHVETLLLSPPSWPNLQTLALTSQILTSTRATKTIDALFTAAACAAKYMPRLRVLELWNGGRGDGCVFRFEACCMTTTTTTTNSRVGKGVGCPTLTLMSTWPLFLEPEVISAWEEVVSKQGLGQQLVVEHTRFPADATFLNHGSMLKYLLLQKEIVSSVSACQIRREAKAKS